ncbi:MAG: hypothetical protein ISS11_08165, partial [Candidatus Marinimicrobia bacterium]|nr:hypothetical protein [Candidatus Neomarinimicrobiota bacterium]
MAPGTFGGVSMIEHYRDEQLSIFNAQTNVLLEKFKIQPATVKNWFNSGYLSFNPMSFDELNSEHEIELEFIASLFNSGITLESIDKMLDKLNKPFRYSFRSVYFNFLNNEWNYLPRYFRDDIFDTIDELYDEDKIAKLEVAKFKIGELIVEYYKDNDDLEKQTPYIEDILKMETKILGAPLKEFWHGSQLMKDAYHCDDPRIVKALAKRHYHLEDQEARSAQILRQCIKRIEGPYFYTLWDMFFDDKEQNLTASQILGEIGGVWSFQKILNNLRREKSIERFLFCLSLTMDRYTEIDSDNQETVQIFDIDTGETKSTSVKDFNSELYKQLLTERKAANEYFKIPATNRVNEMIAILKRIQPDHFH